MASDDIKIAPFNEELLEAGNYRVRLGSKLLIPREGVHVKLGDGKKQSMYDEFDLGQHTYILKPKQFILGQTLEKISLSKKFAAMLDGRTTFARLGLSIHQSSQFIAPGQDSTITTLEFFNAGIFDIELEFGIEVGKYLFFEFSQENMRAYDDYGDYSNQPNALGANE
jgi:dCTP deaminase